MSFLYDRNGQRKYLTVNERRRFLEAADATNAEVHTFCATLAYTGGRISEVLALTPDRVDFADGIIILPCLKKRRPGVNRAVPVPDSLLRRLDRVHSLRARQTGVKDTDARIWPWSRTTAWKITKAVMNAACISGPKACPKGLRHSFGIHALGTKTPITLVQKWLGHARLSTTAIYVDVAGEEERAFAKRYWTSFI